MLSRALRLVLQSVSVGILVLTLATALFGTTIELLNFAPTFVYVIFWLGLPLLSVTLGNVWSVLSPWRAIADATVWVLERGGREARPVLEWTGRWGEVPGGGCALRLRRARARAPAPGVSAHARDRDRPVHVLGSRGDGRLRAGRLDARRRGLRGGVRAPRPDRAVRGPRRPGRRPLAVHGAGRRGATCRGRSCSSRSCSARRASTASPVRAPGRTCSATSGPTSPGRRFASSTSPRRS